MNRYCMVIHRVVLMMALYHATSHTTEIVHGNDPAYPRGFNRCITAKLFDRKSGTFIVGLGPQTEFCTQYDTVATVIDTTLDLVARAIRPNFRNYPQFDIILTQFSGTNGLIASTEFLALSPQHKGLSIVAGVFPSTTNDQETVPEFSTQIITAFELDGNLNYLNNNDTNGIDVFQTPILNDANGNPTPGIMALAASPCNIFAAVRPQALLGGNNSFGQPGSGIALVCIKRVNEQLDCLVVKNAVTGCNGNMATPLNNTSPDITDGTVDFNVSFTCDMCSTLTSVTMYYDLRFERLYIGMSFVTASASSSVAIGYLSGGSLVIDQIVDRAAINPAENEIVVINNPTTGGLQVNHLAVMHASTGPSYLIVNGNRTDLATSPCNRIFALPLVDNPCKPLIHGTLANVNAPLVNNVFVTPALDPGDLANDTEPAAAIGLINTAIGLGQLPIADSTGISDMVVVGDTVYVAISHEPDDFNDTGIFYSQALFGADGKIVSWTPWTKRGIPINAFGRTELPCCSCHTGPVCFLDVDALTGNIWFVEGDTRRVVGITSWSRGFKNCCDDLVGELNKYLQCGCYSVLDLDQGTRLFTNQEPPFVTPYRYALFGGVDQVTIALTSIAISNMPLLDTPQNPITCCTPEPHVIVTQIPNGGCISSLEYSRTTTNFFFAGSTQGLFAFADIAGNGFLVNSLNVLGQAPFTTNSWQLIPSIPGAVVDIKTSGAVEQLYVLVTQPTPRAQFPTTSILYSIPFTNNIFTMFNPSNIKTIAQTGVGIFSTVRQFFGIQIISTGPVTNTNPSNPPLPEDQQQLILATNQGLYKTDVSPQSYPFNAPIDQTEADWQLIPDPQDPAGTGAYMFNGIAGIDTPIKHTVWPFSLHSLDCCKQIEHGRVDQISGASNSVLDIPEIGTFLPEPFTFDDYDASPSTVKAFNALNPITYFWSDGARRFFILRRIQDPAEINRLAVLPYDIKEWNVTGPVLLSNPNLKQEKWFYWVKQIGATGILMAGTNRGVIGLQ